MSPPRLPVLPAALAEHLLFDLDHPFDNTVPTRREAASVLYSRLRQGGPVRHFALRDAPAGTRPVLLFEIQIDFHDVRSGAQVSDYGYWIGPGLDEAGDESWTEDSVRRAVSEELVSLEDGRSAPWPESADASMLDYLQRFYRLSIWKNVGLGLYSTPSESREEFVERCREGVRAERGGELRRLGEIFLHRFIELESRAERLIEQQDWDDRLRASTRDGVSALFSRVREETSRWMSDEAPAAPQEWQLPSLPEVEERLRELTRDLHAACESIHERYEQQARAIEPYGVRATAAALHVVSRNILWERASPGHGER